MKTAASPPSLNPELVVGERCQPSAACVPLRWLLIVALAFAPTANAILIEFDVSPAGKDLAVGLSPGNELFGGLPPDASTGSGGEIGEGITFDSDTGVFSFDFGYGSAFGFSDISEPAFAWLLHGGAGPQATGPVVANLAPFHTLAGPDATSGHVEGSFVVPEMWRDELLADLTYINIYTFNNLGGELRGQLIQVDSNPVDIPDAGAGTLSLLFGGLTLLRLLRGSQRPGLVRSSRARR